jgi:glycine amidinotransferase
MDVLASKNSTLGYGGGEWGAIDTVVLGNPLGAHYPDEVPHLLEAILPAGPTLQTVMRSRGQAFDNDLIEKACSEVQLLSKALKSLGVAVLQPHVSQHSFSKPIVTSNFQTKSGFYAAMPRDNLLLLPPDILVLAPMAWRSRYREHDAYSDVITTLKAMGLTIVTAPKPKLEDTIYEGNPDGCHAGTFRSIISDDEPLFDAADFIRFGNHIIAQLSHVTNVKGVSWVRSILPSRYRLHVIEFADEHPMHIDATIMPLAPGKIMVQPDRVPPALRAILSRELLGEWEWSVVPPLSSKQRSAPLYFTSPWIKMNTLVGDGWMLVEQADDDMVALARSQGLEAISLPFQHFQALGGSFHCCTLDFRKSGTSAQDGINQKEDLNIYFDQVTGRYCTRPLQELFDISKKLARTARHLAVLRT